MILSLTLLATGCVNNIAIQELNNKAAEYMAKGDYENAISRLEASIDLDGNVYETQYNLGVAYTENEDYDKAIETFEKAIKLKPDSADAFYSEAVAYENYAKSLYKGETKQQKEALEEQDEDDEDSIQQKKSLNEDGTYKPSDEELELVKQYYNSAIEKYSKYSEIATASSENSTEDVSAKITELQEILDTLSNGETN